MYQKIFYTVKKLRTKKKRELPKRLHTNKITRSTRQKRCLSDGRILLVYQIIFLEGIVSNRQSFTR